MIKRQAKILSLMGKLMKVEMGYNEGNSDQDSGEIKKRKKWRALVTTTLAE
jgi:monofunctional biosynthetic peptidoglycan transglycosylase